MRDSWASAKKILGHPITELAPLKGLQEIFEQVAKGHPVRNLLLEGELPHPPRRTSLLERKSYSPIYNPDGIVEAIAAVVLEVTTQKRAEAALIQSEKFAAVGRLASSISHEINNPTLWKPSPIFSTSSRFRTSCPKVSANTSRSPRASSPVSVRSPPRHSASTARQSAPPTSAQPI